MAKANAGAGHLSVRRIKGAGSGRVRAVLGAACGVLIGAGFLLVTGVADSQAARPDGGPAGRIVQLHTGSANSTRPVGDLFVKPGGQGDCSQADPCDLATALAVAGEDEVIVLAAGVYTDSGEAVVTLDQSVTLLGGWDGAPDGPVTRDAVSVLDGERARRGVVVSPGVSVTLEGFLIRHGQVEGNGAGLYAEEAHLTLRDVRFEDNAIDIYALPDTVAYGGGAYVEGGRLTVSDCSFTRNSVWAKVSSHGGALAAVDVIDATVEQSRFEQNDAWFASGIWFANQSLDTLATFVLQGSHFVDNGRGLSEGPAHGGYASAVEVVSARALIEDNTFADGEITNDRGALSVVGGKLILANNWFFNNRSHRTSAVFLYNLHSFVVTNNIIVANQSTHHWEPASAVYVHGGTGDLLHNTIARNTSAYGLLADSGAVLRLTNTILVSHTIGISVATGSRAHLDGTLWGSGAWANGTDWAGSGSIDVGAVNVRGDPVFRDPARFDYRIAEGSAAIDAGVESGVSRDIEGDLRPAGDGYDIGADEYLPTGGEPSPTATPGPPMTATATASATPPTTPAVTHTPGASPSPTPEATGTETPVATPVTRTPAATRSPTPTLSPGVTATPTTSPPGTLTPSPGKTSLYLPLAVKNQEFPFAFPTAGRLYGVAAAERAFAAR